MIYIKNKKAWKNMLRDNPSVTYCQPPKDYPCYAYFSYDDMLESEEIFILDKNELEQMIQKIDSGRRF